VLSVIVPVRNGGAFVEEALKSAFLQPEVAEVIVVDDGSSDDSAERAAGVTGTLVLRTAPRGPGAARNTGVRCARQPFVAFLDADDVWLPSKSPLQLLALAAPGWSYALCAFEHFLHADAGIPSGARLASLTGAQRAPLLSSLVVRRDLFLETGGFDEALITAEDVDWFLRARALGFEERFVERVLLRKRLHSHNLSLTSPGNTRRLFDVIRRHRHGSAANGGAQ